jgi:hypothetical protein
MKRSKKLYVARRSSSVLSRFMLSPRKRFVRSSLYEGFPTLAEVILARNVANTTEIEKFLNDFHVEDLPNLNEWLDSTMRKYLINKYDRTRGYTPKASDPDWMQGKTDLETVILDNALTDKLQHLVDFLKNKMTTEPNFNLKSFQAEEAMKQSQEWLDRLKKKKSEEEQEGVDYKVLMDLGNGWKWVDLISQNALTREGQKMGHCVGGYWDRVKTGREKIFSLRDSDNQPHATIEYVPGQASIDQIKGKQNKGVIQEYMPYVLAFLKSPPVKVKKINDYELNLNGLLKTNDGYISVSLIPEGTILDQNLDLKKFDDIKLPKNLTIKGDLIVPSGQESLPENLTVTGTLNLAKTLIRELPTGMKVGSLNLFGLSRLTSLPADIQITKDLNAEFSGLESIPPLKLKGDLVLSDTDIQSLPEGLSVGGELDIMNTAIKTLPKKLKVGTAIFVDDVDAFEGVSPALKALLH